MRPVIGMHACDYDHSAAHGTQWQELELIFGRLLQHGNIRKRGTEVACASLRLVEMFMRACHRPTEAACLRVRKCANNRQLNFAGPQRLLRHACAADFPVIHTRKAPCALRIYTQTVIGVFFVDGNGNTQLRMRVLQDDAICVTSMDAIFKPW